MIMNNNYFAVHYFTFIASNHNCMDPGSETSAQNFSSDTNFSNTDNIQKVGLVTSF